MSNLLTKAMLGTAVAALAGLSGTAVAEAASLVSFTDFQTQGVGVVGQIQIDNNGAFEIYNLTLGGTDLTVAQLEQNPWWGDAGLAQALAGNQVQSGTNFSSEAAGFGGGIDFYTYGVGPVSWARLNVGPSGDVPFNPNMYTGDNYIVASLVDFEAVPEPVSILGSLAMLGLGTTLKRKVAQSDNA